MLKTIKKEYILYIYISLIQSDGDTKDL